MKPLSISPPVPRLLGPPSRSFFLFGPRGVGKSTWLRTVFPHSPRIDLLDSSLFLELSADPHRLEALCGSLNAGAWVVIDEIQKIPQLLDEVHRLMEERRWHFALCGSSARKLRRGGVNLLGGRALTTALEGFSVAELGSRSDLRFLLEWGTLPIVHAEPSAAPDILSAYVHTYLNEEIRSEGIVRRLPPFIRFLSVAGQLNAQVVNGHNISREAGVPRATVDTYFSILQDTLLAHLLPPWRPGVKARESAHPKLYWFDAGVARAAGGRARDPADRSWLGWSLETLIFHELRVYNEVSGKHRPLFYYGTPGGGEVDFIVETRRRSGGRRPAVVAIEVKLAEKWDRTWERGLADLAGQTEISVERAVVVYGGTRSYTFGKVEGMSVMGFLELLHGGGIF